VPFQDNLNLNLTAQAQPECPEYPAGHPDHFSPDWNIITRTIIPVISQPALDPSGSRINGIGPTQISAFLFPPTRTERSGVSVQSLRCRLRRTPFSGPINGDWARRS
jgi:hypothetical protein